MPVPRIELLAPARDLACGLAAVNCGADAVYIGAPAFGAREKAGNSLEDIASLVTYAHKYWARVYVALNTLLNDTELPQALALAVELQSAGVDALIIQDLGLYAGLQEERTFTLPLIASTQLHNSTKEKVAFLESAGFKRVILARELSLPEIQTIRAHARQIELESFVYGALCVCYSGQCYLSYSLGGRSGNRGQCAQPCRKVYRLLDKDGRELMHRQHFLSIRDLNLGEYLQELIQAGISSFKIEGRLKDKYYVMNAVSYLRQQLDSLLPGLAVKKSSSGRTDCSFTPEPAKTFNRGFTRYFLTGRRQPVGSFATPKMQGEPVGKVLRVAGKKLHVQTSVPLKPGDGLTFYNAAGVLCGAAVNAVSGNMVVLNDNADIREGTRLFRNYDHAFVSALKKATCKRYIDVQWLLWTEKTQLHVTVKDEDGNEAAAALDLPDEKAVQPEMMRATIDKQLRKTGDTEFRTAGVELGPDCSFFLPVATLNELRRGLLTQLAQARRKHYPVAFTSTSTSAGIEPATPVQPYPEKHLTYTGNVLNQKALAFFKKIGVESIEPAAESGLSLKGQKVMTCRMCIKHELGWCQKHPLPQPAALQAGTPEPCYLLDDEGHKFKIVFNCRKCEMEIFLE